MKALILNGAPQSDATAEEVREIMLDELERHEWDVHEFVLRDEKIAYCKGCFGCWIKTPGECLIDDAGRDVARAIVESDLVIYLTPVTFGGYSSDLKKALDRMIPIISPFFKKVGGEIHHQMRYDRYPRMMAVGILPVRDDESSEVFETLHARNAINLHDDRAVAGTVTSTWGSDEIARKVIALLGRAEAVS